MTTLYQGDCLDVLRTLPAASVDAVITSPPYGIGKVYEGRQSFDEYLILHRQWIAASVRVLRPGGALCWQVGNHVERGAIVPLDMALYPAFTSAGLTLRNRIAWTFGHGLHCSRRLSGRYETILWFTLGDCYTFNLDPLRVPQQYPNKRYFKGPRKGELSCNPLGKNPGDVWAIGNIKHNHPEKTAHPCQFPEELVRRLVRGMTNPGDTILDPFMGSGTTGAVCDSEGRDFIGIERDPTYHAIAERRIAAAQPALTLAS